MSQIIEDQYKVIIRHSFELDSIAVIVLCNDTMRGTSYCTIGDNGSVLHTKFDDTTRDQIKPFMTIGLFHNTGLLKAFADGLAEAKIFPELPQEDKIKAEAIADERLTELNYFKELFTKAFHVVLNNAEKK
jgi:hypothetical protein